MAQSVKSKAEVVLVVLRLQFHTDTSLFVQNLTLLLVKNCR